MTLFLGLDISTTGAKALLIDDSGRVVSSVTTPLTLSTPRALWSEQNPDDWWTAMASSIRVTLARSGAPVGDVEAIGLTGQMHGLVLLGKEGEVLRPAILWNDQRCGAECEEIRARIGKKRLIQITGNDALTGFTAPKILWVRNHEPDIYQKVRHVLLPKDYIRYKLTGGLAMDKADGSGTMLFDLKARNWSAEVLTALNLPMDWFPVTYEGTDVTGEVDGRAAAETSLNVGTPVVAGGGDQAAQAVGVGAVRPGIVALTLGTSGVIFSSTESPVIEPDGRLHAFCHAMPSRWHVMGVMLSAAGSLQWYRDNVAPEQSFEELIERAANIPAGSDGLLFLPYLTGERTPHPDPLARACWIGLTLRHRRDHLTRAVLEGVAFGLKDCFELIDRIGVGRIEQVRISGGGARSRVWRQIIANVLGIELTAVAVDEGAAYGAALLAAVGFGRWKDVEAACSDTIEITERTSPDLNQQKTYDRVYENYHALYPALKPIFTGISHLDL